MVKIDNLDTLDRKQLQALAKTHGIPANIKSLDLVERIRQCYLEKTIGEATGSTAPMIECIVDAETVAEDIPSQQQPDTQKDPGDPLSVAQPLIVSPRQEAHHSQSMAVSGQETRSPLFSSVGTLQSLPLPLLLLRREAARVEAAKNVAVKEVVSSNNQRRPNNGSLPSPSKSQGAKPGSFSPTVAKVGT